MGEKIPERSCIHTICGLQISIAERLLLKVLVKVVLIGVIIQVISAPVASSLDCLIRAFRFETVIITNNISGLLLGTDRPEHSNWIVETLNHRNSAGIVYLKKDKKRPPPEFSEEVAVR